MFSGMFNWRGGSPLEFGSWRGPRPRRTAVRSKTKGSTTRGCAAPAELVQALELRLMLSAGWRHGGRPTEWAKTINSVGLSLPVSTDYAPGHAPKSSGGGSITTQAGDSSPPGGITPAEMRGAYGISNASFGGVAGNGAGETIAILDPGDDTGLVDSGSPSFASSDLGIFDSYYGLPNPPSFIKDGFTDPTSGTPQLTSTLPAANAPNTSDAEISLDVEWAHAMAPGANILLVEGAPDFSDIFNGVLAIDAAAASMHICVISMSFSGPEDENLSSTANAEGVDGYYFDTPGLVYAAATGDYGAYAEGTKTITSQFPASSSNVLAVGGTTLNINGTSYGSETTWGDGTHSGTQTGGGGGISVYEPQPSYQVGKVNGLSTTARTYPDISLDANPYTGVPIYDSVDYGSGTGWIPGTEGGTSLATPLMAGLVAVADQGRAINGFAPLNSSGGSGVAASNPNGNSAALDIHTLLYGFGYSSSDFHDITSGLSIGPSSYGPKVGYDLSTGLGSPQGNQLVVALSNAGAIAPAVTTEPTSQTVLDTTQVSFTAAASGTPTPTVQWQYSSNGGSTYSMIAGATSNTYSFTTTGSESGDLYEAVFTNVLGSVTTNPATLTANHIITNTAVISSSSTITSGQPVTFTATVTPTTGSGETGTVQFVIDGVNAGSPVTLNNGTASYTAPTLATGTHTVVADYSGDSNFQASQSNQISQIILPGWLSISAGATVLWTQSAETLMVTSGTATLIADPAESRFNGGAGDDPTITVTGAGSKLEIAPTDGSLLVHIGGLSLQKGAVADVASLGAARTHSNHRVLVIGSVNEAAAPMFSIDSASQLNLEDNDMIVHGGNNGSSDFAAVQAAAAEGRAPSSGGPGGVLDGTWTGNGLTSSIAASVDAKVGYEQNVLAVALNRDLSLFGSYTSWPVGSTSEPLRADGNDVIVKYTYNGDAHLDGMVDDTDVAIVNAYYAPGVSLKSQGLNSDWAYGDFNGDGFVDGSDVAILGALYGNGTGQNGNKLPQL